MRGLRLAYYCLGICLCFILFAVDVAAQEVTKGNPVPHALARRQGLVHSASDSIAADTLQNVSDSVALGMALAVADSLASAKIDSIKSDESYLMATGVFPDSSTVRLSFSPDSVQNALNINLQERFIPDPKKAMWLAIVIPGGGQIYNRKYWKLPLVYGGFIGCLYALNWNNTMYRDYCQAYIDIMDSDDNTKSYVNFLPIGYDVEANKGRLQDIFQRKKNFYRRYRDLSIFCMIGVYALSVLDAYIDAELSSFDISRDLSMKVHPTVINERYSAMRSSGMSTTSYGLQCSLSF